ncbi:hypothetical protein CCP2SC5_530020 [Azospirillaceae bacterium]
MRRAFRNAAAILRRNKEKNRIKNKLKGYGDRVPSRSSQGRKPPLIRIAILL